MHIYDTKHYYKFNFLAMYKAKKIKKYFWKKRNLMV